MSRDVEQVEDTPASFLTSAIIWEGVHYWPKGSHLPVCFLKLNYLAQVDGSVGDKKKKKHDCRSLKASVSIDAARCCTLLNVFLQKMFCTETTSCPL